MRKKTILLSVLMLLGLVLSACSGVAAAQSSTPAGSPQRTISVTGNGQIYLQPDIANITIGVHTEGEDVSKAVSQNNSQIQKVIDQIKSMGVADKDIQTSNFNIYQMQQYDKATGSSTGSTYAVDNTVLVTLRDLSKIGDLLNAVVTSGANSIQGIQFDVADKSKAQSEARQAAVDDARNQAEQLAKAAGLQLGDIQSISASANYPIPYYAGKGGAAEAPAAVPISPGQVGVSVDVTIVYQIQ